MIGYDPPVGPDIWVRWQQELQDTLGAEPPETPGAGTLSWPLLHWVPGDDWQPIGRWVIYDMCPAEVLVRGAERRRRLGVVESENQDQFWLDQFHGPHPRQRGKWDGVKKEFVRDPNCLIDRYQWDLWQRYKCHGFVCWIIQGSAGGHLGHYTGEEEQIAKYDGLPASPPNPGALPYAPWDNRVKRRLGLLRALMQMRLDAALNGANWGDSKRLAYRDTILAGKRTLLSGVDDYWDNVVKDAHIPVGELPKGDGPDPRMLNEQITERILTTD